MNKQEAIERDMEVQREQYLLQRFKMHGRESRKCLEHVFDGKEVMTVVTRTTYLCGCCGRIVVEEKVSRDSKGERRQYQ